MAIAFRAQGTPTTSTTTSLIVDVPTGVQAGDYMIAFLHQQTADATDISCSGWTRIGPAFIANDSGSRISGMYAKFASSSEPSTYTFNVVNTGRSMGFMAAYSGVDTTSPVAFSSNYAKGGATNTLTVPPQSANANLFSLEMYTGNFATPNSYALTTYDGTLSMLGTAYNPSGTENTAVSRSAMMVWSGTMGSSGSPTHDIATAGTASQLCAFQISLAAATAGGGTVTPSVVGHTNATSSGPSSTFIVDPSVSHVGSTVAADDWIILILTSASSSVNTYQPTAPIGWQSVVTFGSVGTGTISFGVWAHKRAVGETSYTWTQTTTQSIVTYQRMIFVRNADDLANWTAGQFQNRETSVTTLTNVAPSVNTTTAHTLGLAISVERTTAAETDGQVTCDNFTKEWFENTVDHTLFVATKDMVATGATGAVTITYPNTQAKNGEAGILAIPGTVDTSTGLAIKVSDGATLVDATFKLADGAGGLVTPGAYKVVKPGYATVTQMLAQTDFYCAHRGGSLDFPEMSMYAYGQSALVGYPALEISLARTSDGVWFGLHDASLDRTSLGTGGGSGTTLVAASMTWAQVQAYNILGSTAGNNTSQADRPYMRWEELIAMYYSSHVIFVDPKVAIAFSSEILNMMDAQASSTTKFIAKYYGVSGATNNSTGWCHDAQARGYKTWGYFYDTDSANYATYAPHWDILGMEYTATQTYWDQLAAAAPGKPIMGHICPNAAAVTTAFSKGAVGAMVSGVNASIPPAIT